MKKLTILLFSILISTLAPAHSGRTDSSGGHKNGSTGEYHYHDSATKKASKSSSSSSLGNEDYYNRQFCTEVSGQPEYQLPDKSRIDCLTNTHAFEADWADGLKVYESVGQSLYYAAETGKQPGILLLIRKNGSDKHIRKVRRVIERWKLPIKLVIIDVRNN